MSLNLFVPARPLALLSIGLLAGLPMGAVLAQAPGPAPVVIDRVRSEAISGLKPATGTVHSRQVLQLMAGVAGRLEWVAEAGSWVQAGDLLARVDVTPLSLQRDERQAQIRRAQSNRDYLDRELERLRQLGDSRFVSGGELDALTLQRDMANSDIEIARLQVNQLEDRIARAELRAPFAGVISEQHRYGGEEVALGDAISRLVSTEDLEFRAQLPLSWLPDLRAGDIVHIRAHGEEVLGRIRSLIKAGNADSQTFEARIDFPEEVPWAVGQLAAVNLPERLLTHALMVPRDALVLRREAVYVVRIGEDSQAERVPVSIGRGRGEWISVSGALAAGQAVAVRGAERLETGQSVDIIRDLARERSGGEAAAS